MEDQSKDTTSIDELEYQLYSYYQGLTNARLRRNRSYKDPEQQAAYQRGLADYGTSL